MAEAGRRRWRARRRALGRSDLAAAKLSWRAASGRVLVRTILSWAAVWLVPGCDHGTTTTPTASPTPTAPAAPTPSPTLPPAPTAPVSLDVKLNPNPASGPAPLDLHVSLCGSRPVPPVDGYPLTFTLAWGDDRRVHTRYFCRDDHVYDTPGIYRATFCATDCIEGHETCATVRVKVE